VRRVAASLNDPAPEHNSRIDDLNSTASFPRNSQTPPYYSTE
jgi:hypothetical protein